MTAPGPPPTGVKPPCHRPCRYLSQRRNVAIHRQNLNTGIHECPFWPIAEGTGASGQIGMTLARPLTGRIARGMTKGVRYYGIRTGFDLTLTGFNDLEKLREQFLPLAGALRGCPPQRG